MTDIFISYSRAFRRQISPMVETLRELGLDVWFDAELLAGDVFSDEIESQLKAARCVLVLWTKDALDKGARGWVRSEADWAFQRGKLIQARLGSVRLPPPFFSSVAPPINLTAAIASGARLGAPGWKELLEAVGRFTKRPGLPHLPEAERSDAEMLAWAARYCDDPLAVADAGRASRISRRIQVAREAELIRIRRSANLESELKNLVQETRQAPIRYFDPAKASVASCQDGAEIWPGSANALLELDVNVYGLEFCDLTVERAFDGANPILLVAGEVRNIGRDTKFVPPVRITLRRPRAGSIRIDQNRCR
ncbi:MAG TPA: toll/interleukin-1 receptor domain-containing protein [Terricaulis sp.]|nr:toll/interleukin-1 receptor domain-containing protein [Terricaulis sp.]